MRKLYFCVFNHTDNFAFYLPTLLRQLSHRRTKKMKFYLINYFIFKILLLINVLKSAYGDEHDVAAPTYLHSAYLDRNQTVLLEWRIDTVAIAEQKNLTVLDARVSAPTLGYIGIGFSPNGGMIGADILVLWVDSTNGVAHAQDRHATAYAEPIIDRDQTSILEYGGYENGTHTVMQFRRVVDAGCRDPLEDLTLSTTASVRVIHALGEKDPQKSTHKHATHPAGEFHMEYHGPHKRGSKTLHLLNTMEGQFECVRRLAHREATRRLEFRAQNLTLQPATAPGNATYYHCSFHALPKFSSTVHVIGLEPAVTPRGEQVVHHFAAYMCERGFSVPDPTVQFPCYQEQHDDIKHRSLKNISHCFHTMIFVVRTYENSKYFPENVGFPLTAEDSGRYVLIETHYDLSQISEPYADDSGVRFLIADTPRPQEASHLSVGQSIGAGIIVPGESASFTITGVCPSDCTQKFLPSPHGITLFLVGLHTHIYGRALALRHFRANKELPLIAGDAAFDFDFQRDMPVNVTILPGDQLVLECNYSTAGKKQTTYGGWRTTDEMCSAFLYVTPPLEMLICMSVLSAEHAMAAISSTAAVDGAETAAESALSGPAAAEQLLEVQMHNLHPSPAHDAIRQSEQGVGMIQDMVGLTSLLHKIDWSQKKFSVLGENNETTSVIDTDAARERLQRAYLYAPQILSCGGYEQTATEVVIPYSPKKEGGAPPPHRPLQPREMAPQC